MNIWIWNYRDSTRRLQDVCCYRAVREDENGSRADEELELKSRGRAHAQVTVGPASDCFLL